MPQEQSTRCGYIAILGVPNAGKSTLINQLIGAKIAIVSPKVQTTRQRMLGVLTEGNTQIIFVDTPGLFTPKKTLERSMVGAAWGAISDANVVCFIVDVVHGLSRSLEFYEKLTKQSPIVLLLNKIDALSDKTKLFQIIEKFQAIAAPKEIFMISAETGDGTKEFMTWAQGQMPPSAWLYDPEQTTDLPLRLWAAEITREQLYLQLYEELPYDTYVEGESWEEFDNGSVKIHQKVVVAKEGQKSIVLGSKGTKIKAINQAARKIMEEELGRQVHLFLHVSVEDKWQEKSNYYREVGLKQIK